MALTASQIEQLYVTFYNRPADPIGLAYWEGSGATYAQVANYFGASPEYTATFTGMNNTQIIAQIYENMFNRAPDVGGLIYWTNELTSGALTLGTIAVTIANAALGTDATTLANKVAAATDFTNNINTTPEILAYSGAASNAKASIWLATVGSSAGSLTAALAAEAAVIAVLVPPTTGTTSTLTVGGATPTFTTGTAVPAGSLVLNDAGSGNGGAGNDYALSMPAGASVASSILTINGNLLDALTADVSGTAWASVLTVNLNGGTGAAVTEQGATNVNVISSGAVTIGSTTAPTGIINVTDSGAILTGVVSVQGGSAVTVTETNSDGGVATVLGAVNVGTTTQATGAVVVTETATVSNAASAQGYITVKGGTSVTVTSTVNDSVALAADTGTVTAGNAGLITVAPTSGAVIVNNNTAITSLTTIATVADAVAVTGGSSITVNEVSTTTQKATGVSSITDGAVTITGDKTTTTVTVTQDAIATGTLAVAANAAVAQVNAVTAAKAGPGVQGVTGVTGVPASAAVAAAAGTLTVTANGVVAIADVNAGSQTVANSIATVTLNNYGASTIDDQALTVLNLSGAGGTLGITNSNTAAGLAAASSLAINVSNNAALGAISDVKGEIKTVNITTDATASTIAGITDAGLRAVTVAGSGVLTLGAINAAITSITVSGAAGFNDSNAGVQTAGFAALGSAATFTTTSSGKITLAVNDKTQTFVGSTGQDIITISSLADATKTVTGGSAGNNELILAGGAYALTGLTAANVTGFQTLGVAANVTGPINVPTLGSTFKSLDILGNSTIAFTGVTVGSSVTLEASSTSVNVGYAGIAGAANSATVTIGAATNAAAITTTALTLADSAAVGLGTLNVVSNDVTAGDINVITTLTDTLLANLNVSGTAGLTITNLSPTSAALTITGTETGTAGVTVTTLTDNKLATLTAAGTDTVTITTLNDTAATISFNDNTTGINGAAIIGTLTTGTTTTTINLGGSNTTDIQTLDDGSPTLVINNTGTSTATVGDAGLTGFADANLTSLTLGAGVAFGTNLTAATPMTATGATTGVTVIAGSDNAHISLALTGAAATKTDTITVGNGNDLIVDTSSAGTVNITVGTGSNLIKVASGDNTAGTLLANITLGAHTVTTGADSIFVSDRGTNIVTPNTIITGATAGDILNFVDTTAGTVATTTQFAAASVAAGLATALVATLAHGTSSFTFAGNTYLVQEVALNTAAATTTFIELIGTHTFGSNTAGVTVLLT